MILVYLLGVVAFLVFAGGVTAFIIMLVKKVKWWGSCLVLVGVLSLTGLLILAALGFWVYEKSGDKVDSAKDFLGQLEEVKEEAEKVSEEMDKISTNTSTNTSSDTNTSTTKDDDYYQEQGMLLNEDYNFLLTVGVDKAKKFTVKETTSLDGVTSSYTYCYKTTDTSFEPYDCPAGTAPSFSINVYTASQWTDVSTSPFVGTLMGQDGGYYFAFSHPNGLLPSDVPTTDEFYDSVIMSIDFAD